MKLHRFHTIGERFWSRVEITDSCWLWNGHGDGRGYGFIRFNAKQWRTHQFSWMLHFGPIPSGMYVCHTCDNPRCVHPAHLFLGSHADNMRDKANKGRAAMKVTADDVKAIKQKLNLGISQKAIAADFRVDQSLISRISTGKIWRHVCA